MIKIDKQKHQILSYCHYKYLQPLLKKRIESIIKEKSIKIKNKDIPINQATKNCLEYIKNNLQKILLANAEELKELIKYFEANYPCLVIDYKKEPKPPLYSIVYNIFVSNGYSGYFSKTHEKKQLKKMKFKSKKNIMLINL